MLKQLLSLFPHEDIGWKDLGETFVRYTLIKTPWFRLYLHNLIAPQAHEKCHNHPWNFVALVLKGGYWEYSQNLPFWTWREPGTVLLRPAEWLHNVITKPEGMWSLVLTGPKAFPWGFFTC